jgi:DNA-binding Xre family transcriptional regulator
MSTPDPIDVAVGARVRHARELRRQSQTALGEAIGVSFQQVQKYERGVNRISASALVRIAQFLGSSPADLLPPPQAPATTPRSRPSSPMCAASSPAAAPSSPRTSSRPWPSAKKPASWSRPCSTSRPPGCAERRSRRPPAPCAWRWTATARSTPGASAAASTARPCASQGSGGMTADWKCPEDRFPMMGPGFSRINERAITVPFAFVQAHEKQVHSNHGQTVARLKERGGLGWAELADIVAGRGWGETRSLDPAHEQVMRALFAWQAPAPSTKETDGA